MPKGMFPLMSVLLLIRVVPHIDVWVHIPVSHCSVVIEQMAK